MCLEDIRNGRDQTAISKTLTVPNGVSTLLCAADPMRTRLVVSADGTTTLGIAPNPGLSSTSGLLILTAQTPVITLRVEEWGKLVTAAWSGFCIGGNVITFVAEIGLEKQ